MRYGHCVVEEGYAVLCTGHRDEADKCGSCSQPKLCEAHTITVSNCGKT